MEGGGEGGGVAHWGRGDGAEGEADPGVVGHAIHYPQEEVAICVLLLVVEAPLPPPPLLSLAS